jgi:hypothetical protein
MSGFMFLREILQMTNLRLFASDIETYGRLVQAKRNYVKLLPYF